MCVVAGGWCRSLLCTHGDTRGVKCLREAALVEPLHRVSGEREEALDARRDRRALEETEHRITVALRVTICNRM